MPDHNPNACHICGQAAFRWGWVSRSDSGRPHFREDEGGWLQPTTPLKARLCETCGNVQWFAEDKIRKLKDDV